ncbi:hypothetical protein LBMAG53_16060 [Planctomycetota bacterium]|nr:hypothetical protein LBMAG53_16060 [Planctomycetota bacterium]
MPDESRVLITWLTADGEEHEERWPSVERFRAWALAERLDGSFTASVEDEDGDYQFIERGRISPS